MSDNAGVVLFEFLICVLVIIIGYHLDEKLDRILSLLKPADAKETTHAK